MFEQIFVALLGVLGWQICEMDLVDGFFIDGEDGSCILFLSTGLLDGYEPGLTLAARCCEMYTTGCVEIG